MKRIIHELPNGYRRTIVDLTQENLEGWDVELLRKDNDSGELKLTICDANPEFDKLCTMRSALVVMDDEREIWRGRVTEQRLIQYWQKKIVCKGLMDYLYDAVILPQALEGSAESVLSALIAQFNAKVELHKRFAVGAVLGISDIHYEIRSPQKCFKILSDLADEFGGSLKAYRDGDSNVIEWRAEAAAYRPACSQKAVFGENVSKLDILIDGDDIATVLIGRGKNELQCSVQDDEAVLQFGIIEDVESFSDIEDLETLQSQTKAALQERIKEVRSIHATALDRSAVDPSFEPYEEGCYVRLISEPHGIDEMVLINEITDPIFRPSRLQATLGASLAAASSIMRRVI